MPSGIFTGRDYKAVSTDGTEAERGFSFSCHDGLPPAFRNHVMAGILAPFVKQIARYFASQTEILNRESPRGIDSAVLRMDKCTKPLLPYTLTEFLITAAEVALFILAGKMSFLDACGHISSYLPPHPTYRHAICYFWASSISPST